MLLLVRHNHCPQYLCHNHQAVDQHDDHWSITMIANCGGRCIYWRSKAAGWPSASWSQCWCREGFCFWAALLRLRFPFLVGLILQIHLMMTCDDADRWWLGDGYNSFSDFIFLPLAGTIEVNLTSNLISPERLEWTLVASASHVAIGIVGALIIYCAQGAFYLNKLLQFWPTEWVLWTKKETKNMKTAFARGPLSPDGQTVGMQMRFRELFSQKPASKWSADSLGQTAVLWFTNKEGCVSTRQCATTHCHTNHTTP